MSIDVRVQLYFPTSNATQVLEATRQALRRPRYRLGIQIQTPDGVVVRLPTETDFHDHLVAVEGPGGTEMIKVPTISALFPNVIGEEPVFILGEKSRISGLTAEVAFRSGGKVVDALPVGLELARGRDYLELTLSSLASGMVDHFVRAPFRSKVGKILEAGGGVAAVYEGMGEWSAFSDHRPIEGPEVDDEPVDVDALADYLIERLGESS